MVASLNPWHLLFALLAAAAWMSHLTATVVPAVCDGGGDCVKYLAMAQGFADGVFPPIEHPFNLRIAAPWIVSGMVSLGAPDFTQAFLWLNYAAASAFVVCVYGAMRGMGFRSPEFFIVILWFFLHPLGFRLYYTVPASVDPLAYAFLAAILWLFVARQRTAMWLVVLAALFVKESFQFIAMIGGLAEAAHAFFNRGEERRKAIASALGGVAAILAYKISQHAFLSGVFPQKQEYYIGAVLVLGYWGLQAIKDPSRFIVWAGAFFCSTGFFSAYLLGKWRWMIEPEKARLTLFLGAGAAGFAAFGLLAGSDMSRIIFNGNLLILSFCLLAARERGIRPLAAAALSVAGIVMMFWYTDFFPSAFEYGYYGSRRISETAVFAALSLLVVAIFHLSPRLLSRRKG